jgi:Glycosyl transferase 4-like domain
MKVLFHHLTPFALAPGGPDLRIVRTHEALQKLGVEVEYLRWYDGAQKTGDVLHFFGTLPGELLQLARQKGMRIVLSNFLEDEESGSRGRLAFRKNMLRVFKKTLPGPLVGSFTWDACRLADACIVASAAEAETVTRYFDAPPEKVHIVPDGVVSGLSKSPSAPDDSWLETARQLKALYESLLRTSR